MNIETAKKVLPNGRVVWIATAWRGSVCLAECERATMADATRAALIEVRRPAPKIQRKRAA